MKAVILCAGVFFVVMALRVWVLFGFGNNVMLLGGIGMGVGGYGVFFERLRQLRWLNLAMGVGFFAVLALAAFVAIYGRRTTADFTEDVVIVLGGGMRYEQPLPMLQRRLDTAWQYHQRNPQALMVVTGGIGNREVVSEAYVMARELITMGVPPHRIILEEEARSTYENMRLTRDLLQAYNPDAPLPRVAIVTSNFHIYRSIQFAQRMGFENPTAYPATTPPLRTPFYMLREVAAVVKMWVIGR